MGEPTEPGLINPEDIELVDYDTVEEPINGEVTLTNNTSKEGNYTDLNVGNTGLHIRNYENGRKVWNFMPEDVISKSDSRSYKYALMFAFGMYELYLWSKSHPDFLKGVATNETNPTMANFLARLASETNTTDIFTTTTSKKPQASAKLEKFSSLPKDDPLIEKLKTLHSRARKIKVDTVVPIPATSSPNP